jgi:tripartite-type tricarboxylate transporter receptor subunit TctC
MISVYPTMLRFVREKLVKEMQMFRLLLTFWVATFSILASAQNTADQYPNKPIKAIIPFGPGSSADVLARIFSDKLTQRLKQPFIIENRVGAGGTIGVSYVTKAPADGYTILITTSSPLTINPLADKNVSYKVESELIPVAVLNSIGLMLVSSPSLPPKTLPELIAYLKKNPGKYSYGTNGNGSYSHMCMELFKKELGLDLVHVPYKAATQAETDVIGGQVTLMFDAVTTGGELVKSGRLKSFGISSRAIDPLSPAQKPLASQGIPELKNFDVTAFTGVLVPSGTPTAIVNILKNTFIDILADPQFRAEMAQRGIPLSEPLAASQMDKLLADDKVKWGALVKSANITLD